MAQMNGTGTAQRDKSAASSREPARAGGDETPGEGEGEGEVEHGKRSGEREQQLQEQPLLCARRLFF